MEYTNVTMSIKNHIANIEMNNPKSLNPLDLAMTQDLTAAFRDCQENEEVKVMVLTGAGRCFCGGGDIHYMMNEVKAGNFDIAPLVTGLTALTWQIKKCPKPVIAVVQGAAAGGGCNLAWACDMVYAEENAKFLQAFVNIGLTPDTSGAFWLPRLIGPARAFEMFASGRVVKAQEAYDLGLVTQVTSQEDLLSTAMAAADKLAHGPSVVYKGIKAMMLQSLSPDFAAFMRCEKDVQVDCTKTHDFVEGITAFLEKRKANFQGK